MLDQRFRYKEKKHEQRKQACSDTTNKTSKGQNIKTSSQKSKSISKLNKRYRPANTSEKQKVAFTTNKELNTSFTHGRKRRKRKATNMHNEDSSSDEDKPLIFFNMNSTKNIQEETDVEMDPTTIA